MPQNNLLIVYSILSRVSGYDDAFALIAPACAHISGWVGFVSAFLLRLLGYRPISYPGHPIPIGTPEDGTLSGLLSYLGCFGNCNRRNSALLLRQSHSPHPF